MFTVKLVAISAVIGYVTWILAGYNGLSWTVVITIIVVLIYHFITTKTIIGRHVYAVGGNAEAAKLSGINVERITMIVFASIGNATTLFDGPPGGHPGEQPQPQASTRAPV